MPRPDGAQNNPFLLPKSDPTQDFISIGGGVNEMALEKEFDSSIVEFNKEAHRTLTARWIRAGGLRRSPPCGVLTAFKKI